MKNRILTLALLIGCLGIVEQAHAGFCDDSHTSPMVACNSTLYRNVKDANGQSKGIDKNQCLNDLHCDATTGFACRGQQNTKGNPVVKPGVCTLVTTQSTQRLYAPLPK
jgi:hypothetical protein